MSEPYLKGLSRKVNHKRINELINLYLPNKIITIETIAENNKDYLTALEKSLKIATENYQKFI